MTTDGAWFMPYGYITMVCPLSRDDDKWRRMFHTWMIYNQALTVALRRWQLTEHVSYMNDILPCFDSCHEMMTIDERACSVRCYETMTTDGKYFIHEWYIAMLWPLSRDDDNWLSMFYTWGIYHHALVVVMRQWQLTENDPYLRDIWPCSVSCNEAMTNEGACLIHEWYLTIFWPLSWDGDNWGSMIHT